MEGGFYGKVGGIFWKIREVSLKSGESFIDDECIIEKEG